MESDKDNRKTRWASGKEKDGMYYHCYASFLSFQTRKLNIMAVIELLSSDSEEDMTIINMTPEKLDVKIRFHSVYETFDEDSDLESRKPHSPMLIKKRSHDKNFFSQLTKRAKQSFVPDDDVIQMNNGFQSATAQRFASRDSFKTSGDGRAIGETMLRASSPSKGGAYIRMLKGSHYESESFAIAASSTHESMMKDSSVTNAKGYASSCPSDMNRSYLKLTTKKLLKFDECLNLESFALRFGNLKVESNAVFIKCCLHFFNKMQSACSKLPKERGLLV